MKIKTKGSLKVCRRWNICVVKVLHEVIRKYHKGNNSLYMYKREQPARPCRGLDFRKFNPPLLAVLSLPRTEIRPNQNEGVI